MRLRITGYYQGKDTYIMDDNGLIMNYMEYGVKPESKV